MAMPKPLPSMYEIISADEEAVLKTIMQVRVLLACLYASKMRKSQCVIRDFSEIRTPCHLGPVFAEVSGLD